MIATHPVVLKEAVGHIMSNKEEAFETHRRSPSFVYGIAHYTYLSNSVAISISPYVGRE
jgi:hypothetical protein